MSDLNNIKNISMQDLQNLDFSKNTDLFKDAELNRLLNEEGVFSLDDAGQLVVVNPSKKLDNAFFRFIGGLFSSSYKSDQNTLERAFVLQKNASFNKLLRNSFLKQRADAIMESPNKEDNVRVMSTRIRELFNDPTHVTTTKLKDIASSNRQFSRRLGSVADASMLTADVGSGIMVKGVSISPYDFVKKYADTNDIVLNNRSLATSILLRATKFPDSFSAINKEKEAHILRNLMCQSKLSEDQDFKLKEALSSILTEMRNRMVNSVDTALEQGKDLKSVANHLQSALIVLSGKFMYNDPGQPKLLENVFIQLDQHNGLIDAKDPRDFMKVENNNVSAAMEKFKQELPDLTDKNLSKIIAYQLEAGAGELKNSKINNSSFAFRF